jgi:Ca2+-binding RTX toxin-like protein
MKTPLLVTLAALLVLPAAASAATATADIENRSGTRFGPVTFKAALGEENLVKITQANGRLRFHDGANQVTATGDCERVDRHTASCPVTEDVAKVKLGDGLDSATVSGLVEVLGGAGRDFLTGSRGFDDLNGQAGRDTLTGKGRGDELTGAGGRDLLFGGRGDDDLIDGERDGNAAADVLVGGSSRDTADPDRGDMVVYTLRERGIQINLSSKRHGTGPGRDDIAGIESVSGGAGDDRLVGDQDDNELAGNGGDDVLRGKLGDDTLGGGGGSDSLSGGGNGDFLSGHGGTDFLDGDGGSDLVISEDDSRAERVECGYGSNDIARPTRLDTLVQCEIANTEPLYIRVQPRIEGDTATFQVACQRLHGCDGTLELNGRNGEDFGSGDFADLPDDPETFSPVTVDLTDAAVDALAAGVTVQVVHGDAVGGYRALMQSG